jgi:hypothetical protein
VFSFYFLSASFQTHPSFSHTLKNSSANFPHPFHIIRHLHILYSPLYTFSSSFPRSFQILTLFRPTYHFRIISKPLKFILQPFHVLSAFFAFFLTHFDPFLLHFLVFSSSSIPALRLEDSLRGLNHLTDVTTNSL